VPTRTGDWQIACAQLCGNSHFKMKGIFKVQKQEDFVAWIERYQSENVVEKSTGISKNTLALGGTLIAGLAIGLAWWNSGRRKGE